MTMNGNQTKIWMDAVMAHFNALSWNFVEVTVQNHR
jgi:hypothetical protein